MGKQGWCQTWCQGSMTGNALEPWHKPGTRPKWLKFILILSNFLGHPALSTLVTTFIFFVFSEKNFECKFSFSFPGCQGLGILGWKRPSYLTQTVCTEKERNRERKREKTERKHSFFPFFFWKKSTPAKKKMPWHQGEVPCHPGARVPIQDPGPPSVWKDHTKDTHRNSNFVIFTRALNQVLHVNRMDGNVQKDNLNVENTTVDVTCQKVPNRC
jgi:hypothetical protein